MPVARLRRGDVDLLRALLAEHALEGARLHLVVEVSGCSVGVDVADCGLVDYAGVPERDLDRLHRAVGRRIGRRDVVGVAGGAVPGELGVDLRAARLRVLLGLEDQHRRALAHHESVAVGVERTARLLRSVVEVGGKRLLLHEAAYGELHYDRLAATGHDDVGTAGADEVERKAERVGRRRARRGDDLARALRAKRDGDVTRTLVRDQLGDGERRQALRALLEERLERLAGNLEPSDAHAEDGRDAVHVRLRLVGEASVGPRLLRGGDCVLREARHMAGRLPVEKTASDGPLLEALDLRRDLACAARGVERRDPPDARLAGLYGLPGRLPPVAYRRKHSDARYHYLAHVPSCFVEISLQLRPGAVRPGVRQAGPEADHEYLHALLQLSGADGLVERDRY